MLAPSVPAGGSWVLSNADHVVALSCCLGLLLLFRRTVQRRHFGLPTHNDGALGREYIVALGGRLFHGGAWLVVGVADIVARGTIMEQCCECEVGQHGGGVDMPV